MSAKPDIVTAAVLVIGDEILSGRTKDKNIGYIADYLTAIGIDLKEVRVVADDAPAIVAALDSYRLLVSSRLLRVELCRLALRHDRLAEAEQLLAPRGW